MTLSLLSHTPSYPSKSAKVGGTPKQANTYMRLMTHCMDIIVSSLLSNKNYKKQIWIRNFNFRWIGRCKYLQKQFPKIVRYYVGQKSPWWPDLTWPRSDNISKKKAHKRKGSKSSHLLKLVKRFCNIVTNYVGRLYISQKSLSWGFSIYLCRKNPSQGQCYFFPDPGPSKNMDMVSDPEIKPDFVTLF